jgi:hypothetical protein
MTKFNLIKTRDGQRSGSIQSYFYGDSIDDSYMLNEVKEYLTMWIEEYNNSIPSEEIEEMLEGFDGSFRYDVWSFELEREEE